MIGKQNLVSLTMNIKNVTSGLFIVFATSISVSLLLMYLQKKEKQVFIQKEFSNLNPTAENIAMVIYNLIEPEIDPALELKILLYETERNYVEYPA